MLRPSSPLFAYGPVPGVELIPYFLALVGWVILALLGVFFSPLVRLIRRLRGSKAVARPDEKQEAAAEPSTVASGASQPSTS